VAKNRQIKATLVLSEGNFFTNVKRASSGLNSLKKNFDKNSSSMKKHTSVLDSTGNSLTSLAKKVAGVAAAYVSISSVTNFMKECVSAADVQAAAEKRLETTIMNVKGATLEGVTAIKNYAAELQGVTTVGDEVTIQGASQLATFQLQSDTIKTLLPSLQDLAVAQYGTAVSGDQMQQMANLMGKVMSGNVSSLSRYGVVMNDTQKKILKTGSESQKAAMLVEVLGQNFGGLAQAMANTPAGRVQQLKNAWGDMQEVIGAKLYPIITNVLTYLTDKIPSIQSAIGGVVDSIIPILSTVWEGIKQGAKTAGDMISLVKDNWSWLAPVIGGVVGAIVAYKTAVSVATGVQWAMNAAMSANPIGIIIVGIAALIGGLIALYKNCEGFRNAVNTAFSTISTAAKYVWEQIKIVWSAVSPFFTKIWEGIKVAVSVLKVYLIGMFKTAWETIKFCWGNVINFFKTIWETIKGIFSVVKSVLSGDWQGAWNAIKGIVGTWGGFFSGVWEGIKNVFGSVGDWFGSVFTSAWEMVKNAFSNVVGFFQGIWDTIKNMFTSIGTTIADGISGAFKSVINAVIKFAGGLINNFIRGINWAIDKINTIPGVNISKLTEISLPMLAKGGIIRRGGDVIVGERGPEMLSLPRGAQVTPLPAGATSGGNTYTNTFYVTVNADDGSAAARFVRQVKEILDNM
jgi:phage-related protein